VISAHHVIKKPLITEKGTFHSGEFNRYTFMVDPRATKTDIKRAIQELYKVRVVGVNTINRRSPNRATRFGLVRGLTSKRAIVRIHKDDKIELV
jgi:large subunit ribosomal protein L23